MNRIVVVMPAWNEAEGLPSFLMEIHEALKHWIPLFVVVNDCSTDRTAEAVDALVELGIPVTLRTNPTNLGHGPSTILALQIGLALTPDVIVAIDGDGQFLAADVERVAASLLRAQAQVVEGVRQNRGDPTYRRVVSLLTRILVGSRARSIPQDANTPLRAYVPDSLAEMISVIPQDAVTPNLLISVLSRRLKMKIVEIEVQSIPRRGGDPSGSTWGKTRKSIPNRKFVKFCGKALHEWFSTRVEKP